MSKNIRRIYTEKGLTPPGCKRGGKHHTEAFHRIVAGIETSGGARSPHAVAMAKLGKRKAFKK